MSSRPTRAQSLPRPARRRPLPTGCTHSSGPWVQLRHRRRSHTAHFSALLLASTLRRLHVARDYGHFCRRRDVGSNQGRMAPRSSHSSNRPCTPSHAFPQVIDRFRRVAKRSPAQIFRTRSRPSRLGSTLLIFRSLGTAAACAFGLFGTGRHISSTNSSLNQSALCRLCAQLDFGQFWRRHRARGTRYIGSFSTISRALSSMSFIRPKLPNVRQRPSVFDQ
jgi:hypothetical protein